MIKKTITTFSLLGLTLSYSSAAVIFNLRDTAFTTEIESGIVLRGGITATIQASDGALNQTSSSFGINAAASGDDTDEIANGSGAAEFITLSFDQDVILNSVTLELFSPAESSNSFVAESADLNIAGTSLVLFDTGFGVDVFNAPANILLTAGDTVVLTWVEGNGFSFSEFSVDAVPEPASSYLFGLGFLVLLTKRYR